MKRKLCLLALLCLFCSANAQIQLPVKSLEIWESIPEVTLTNIMNHPTGRAKLSEFKGKLLILDFWATWCSPCIAAFPKTDSLRKKFQGRADILPVTYQTKEEVEKLFKKAAYLRPISMPMVTGDNTLRTMFPHRELPHYVWIDPAGKVIAITGPNEVNETNIEKLLASSAPALKQKTDRAAIPYDGQIPLFFNQVEIEPQDIRYEVLLMGYKDGYSSGFNILRYSDNSISRLTARNSSLRTLYMLAYSYDTAALTRQRIIMEVREPDKLEMLNGDVASGEDIVEWRKKNAVCYESLLPQTLSKNFFTLMRHDLDRLFPQYKAGMEKRKVKCLSLERTSKVDKISTRHTTFSQTMDLFEVDIKNASKGIFIGHLSWSLQHLNLPVIDNTNIRNKIDLSIECDFGNLEDVRAALKKYDLDLVERVMPIDMLIIKDNP